LGLTYRVRTSNAYHPSYIQNLKFLQDFWTHPFTLSQQAERQVLDAVSAYPGVSVAALLSAHPDLIVDVVWAMLSTLLATVYTRAGVELTDPQGGCKLRNITNILRRTAYAQESDSAKHTKFSD
jgi:hypothetical protein